MKAVNIRLSAHSNSVDISLRVPVYRNEAPRLWALGY